MAHRLSTGQGFVRRLIREGKLKAIRLETRWRIDVRDLELYLEQCRQAALDATTPASKPFPRVSA